jgi:DNA-binding MarR family transcriptional regulator
MAQSRFTASPQRGEQLLFLTDDQLRQGIELMFFAYRDFNRDPDDLLERFGYGRAHHRALYLINGRPGLTVNALIDMLAITKQSLNRVLRELLGDALVESRIGTADRRQRNLFLTPKGRALEQELSAAQRRRLRTAYSNAGPEAVAGFRAVLEQMIDPDLRGRVLRPDGDGDPDGAGI